MARRTVELYFKRLPFPSSNNLKKPYIVPVKFGFYYAMAVLIMLVIGFNYSNNLVYIWCFFLTSVGLSAMYQTNQNLAQLELQFEAQTDFFAGQKSFFRFKLKNFGSKASYNILFFTKNNTPQEVSVLLPGAVKTLEYIGIYDQRGWRDLEPYIIQSYFPFHLLKTWKLFRFKNKVLVFPAPRGSEVLPVGSTFESLTNVRAFDTHEKNLFKGHKPYQSGDNVRHIDWKAYSRTQKLLIKEFESDEGLQTQHFHLDQTKHLPNIEDQLSQLTFWILHCEKKQLNFSLQLGDFQSPATRGPTQLQNCLRALALYEAQK